MVIIAPLAYWPEFITWIQNVFKLLASSAYKLGFTLHAL